MEVILDDKQQPKGVYIPLREWEQLKHGIYKASELYKLMDELSQPDVFDMDADELSAHLSPVAEQVVKETFDQDLYISYPAVSAGLPNAFIHEYRNGKKVLVQVDTNTGKEHFIRNL